MALIMQNIYTLKPLELQFINVGLQSAQNKTVFRELNFSISQGEFYFLTGASASGKTSLLELIYLRRRPTTGQIKLLDHNTTWMKRTKHVTLRRQIGIILQDFNLVDHLSVLQNTLMPLRVQNLMTRKNRTEYTQNASDLLRWVGLGSCLHALPNVLSAGEKQRAAIARAVITHPKLLIADEPMGTMDVENASKILHLFAKLNQLGTTIIIATHNEKLIPKNAHRLHLQNGYIHHIPPDNIQTTQPHANPAITHTHFNHDNNEHTLKNEND